MSHLSNKPETEEIGENFRNVINDRRNTKQSWGSPIILQMPEEEGKDQSNTETHEPCNEKKRCTLQVLELLKNRQPFWYFTSCLGEHFRLKRIKTG